MKKKLVKLRTTTTNAKDLAAQAAIEDSSRREANADEKVESSSNNDA